MEHLRSDPFAGCHRKPWFAERPLRPKTHLRELAKSRWPVDSERTCTRAFRPHNFPIPCQMYSNDVVTSTHPLMVRATGQNSA